MLRQKLTKLDIPDNSGIYIFRDAKKRPLYIGRATSLHDRTLSYFSPDIIETRGPRIVDMVTKAVGITWQETSSVLEAIFLESALIKKYQPYYNVDERDDKSSLYLIITNEEWPRVFLERVRDYDQKKEQGVLPYDVKHCFGPFLHTGLIKEALKILRRLFPFRDKKANDPKHEAFYRALGRSPERDSDRDREQYQKTIDHLVLFFQGKKNQLQRDLEREMKEYVKKLEFEEADKAKKLIYALDHINDIALLKRDLRQNARPFRIEAYDIAHMGGTNVVGAMVVLTDGQLDNSQYRKFKISEERSHDIAGLAEVLSRRLNHTEWQYPDLIVLDGNEVQKAAAEAVLKARRIGIPVVAVTKDDKHKADRLIGNDELIKEYKLDIIALNAECHRFAIAYHRQRRRDIIPR
ncbi:MAG: GIY-YIG nuclease family protein [Candidatus Paceibacterota bacterium]